MIQLYVDSFIPITEYCAVIDFENKYFRSVMSIAGINFGSWKLFNQPEYISIFKKQTVFHAVKTIKTK